MQASGISPNLVRVLASTASDLLAEMFTPGKVLDAEVISLFQDRAMLSFGKGIRLEVALQAPLREGQRVRLLVQPRQQGGSLVMRLVQPAAPAPGQPAAPPPAQPGAPAPAQPAPPPPAQPAAPAPVQPAAPTFAEQADPQRFPVATAQGSDPALVLIPVPLEAGKHGWACLHFTEDESRRSGTGKPVHQVRLWWETPALGRVQVDLDTAGESLTALFTVLASSARRGLENGLPALQDRLSQAGFVKARVRSRQAAPGEATAPVATTARLDRRI